MARKVKDGRSIYLSHNDFGSLRSYNILPKITDFGLAQIQQEPGQLNRHPIQPDHYRAPEVILGAGWAYGVDIWNLGVMVWSSSSSRRQTLNTAYPDVEFTRESRFILSSPRPGRVIQCCRTSGRNDRAAWSATEGTSRSRARRPKVEFRAGDKERGRQALHKSVRMVRRAIFR